MIFIFPEEDIIKIMYSIFQCIQKNLFRYNFFNILCIQKKL